MFLIPLNVETLHNQKRETDKRGPVQDLTSGEWRRRSDEEVKAMTNQPYNSSLARERRLEWAGHVVRAPKALETSTRATRLEGDPQAKTAR